MRVSVWGAVLPVLLLLFIVVPIAELAVIIAVGREIGVGPTVLVLLADAVLGSMLARSQGRAAWRRFSDATRAGRPPAREVIDGALILFGGALLLTPGFLTDIVGILLLLPPTRAVARRVLVKRLAHRMVVAMTAPRGPAPPRTRGPADVEGTGVDVDRSELP